ncbi:phosphoinositol 3-phosphate-binding protein, putative [Pediculus humanus corporis]|uniref:Phosphoinositol 3-phosphate-binding protein, putative n=1 Tax=Pediculus humanus subsp. corporis TaxID=121224 RepID=E0VKE4_PEDHC|nr:phosphoinositol 3-phosphate-binding protein, putative [Pediculus humanus corporis]EEB13860.1 phosphoinositol 3-phosphate-binding protein, putative [Pediculus humanus corporis]
MTRFVDIVKILLCELEEVIVIIYGKFEIFFYFFSRLDPEITQTSPSPSSQSGRRKSVGSSQLRSPVVKRPTTAPVALQGWLHKQGSEGLMLWKKRWFVLSEYCLFYYKGPEEEKLLGSILLPSYKVSPCTAEDKVYRKYAFKAEHANMRTYYFAAETRELMTEWTNALSLASILQEGTKMQSHDVNLKQNNDEFNFRMQGNNNSYYGPVTMQPTSQDKNMKDRSGNVNGWVPQNPCGPYQPLYANAPPKPKRLNSEGQYAGSSPEASPNRRDDPDNVVYDRSRRFQETATPVQHQDYNYHPYSSQYSPGSAPSTDGNRSVPYSGAYSGSGMGDRGAGGWGSHNNSNNPSGQVGPVRKENQNNNRTDLFKNENYYPGISHKSSEQNFLNYGNSKDYSSANYQHSNQYYQSYQQQPLQQQQQQPSKIPYEGQNSMNVVGVKSRQPPRPHSADFLDYDAKNYYPNKKYTEKITPGQKINVRNEQYNYNRPPRPKSSLEIMHSNDGYYWSEERYAEKMRQSAMYLQNSLPQRSHLSGANTPVSRRLDDSFKYQTDAKIPHDERETPIVFRQKRVEDILKDLTKSPSRQNPRRWSEHQDRSDNNFMRSASARLPKQRQHDEEAGSDEIQAYTGGEDFNEGRKEESMKRLLEWKQRMLQSPLTRKSSGSSARGVTQNELSVFCKQQQVLKDLEKREETRNREESSSKKRNKGDDRSNRNQNRIPDGRRSALLSADRYYSYSSDDEDVASSFAQMNGCG